MSQYNTSGHKGYVATAALTEGQLVKLSSGEVVKATAATDDIIGVVTNDCEAAEVVDVRLVSAGGTSKVLAGGSISVGNYLTSDANGKAVAYTQTAAGAQPTATVIGQALEAGSSGDLIEVLNVYFLG